jgi:hypothetical protein
METLLDEMRDDLHNLAPQVATEALWRRALGPMAQPTSTVQQACLRTSRSFAGAARRKRIKRGARFPLSAHYTPPEPAARLQARLQP